MLITENLPSYFILLYPLSTMYKDKVESIHIHLFGDVFIFAEPKMYLLAYNCILI